MGHHGSAGPPIALIQALTDAPCIAASYWDVPERKGTIYVTMRSDYTPALKKEWDVKNVKADQRDSVVHEMLHNVVENMTNEGAVQVITRLLKP